MGLQVKYARMKNGIRSGCHTLYLNLCAEVTEGKLDLMRLLLSRGLSYCGRAQIGRWNVNDHIYTGMLTYPAHPNLNNELLMLALQGKPAAANNTRGLITAGHEEIVKLLCQHEKTDLNLEINGLRPLTLGIATHNPNIIKCLYLAGARLANEEGVAENLFIKAIDGDADSMSQLVISGKLRLPIHFAFSAKLFTWLKTYLNQLTDVSKLNETDGLGETPFYIALRDNHIEFQKQLVSKGANVNQLVNGITPLNLLVMLKRVNEVGSVVQMGVDINAVNANDLNALQYSVLKSASETECLALLTELLAPNLPTKFTIDSSKSGAKNTNARKSALTLAVEKKYTSLTKELIVAGAKNGTELTVLQLIIAKLEKETDCVELVKLLFDRKAPNVVDIDACDIKAKDVNAKKTPLAIAVSRSFKEAAKLLILAGAKYEDDSALKTQMGAKKIDYVALSAVRAQACHAAQKKQEAELAELAKRQLEVEHSNTEQHQLLPALITRQQQLEQFALMFLGILGNQPVAENGPGGVQQLENANQPRLANAAANNQPAPENAAGLLANAGLFNQRQPVQPNGVGAANASVTRADYCELRKKMHQQEQSIADFQQQIAELERQVASGHRPN